MHEVLLDESLLLLQLFQFVQQTVTLFVVVEGILVHAIQVLLKFGGLL